MNTHRMPNSRSLWGPIALFLVCLLLWPGQARSASADACLWQIGKEDRNSREFALGPGGYARYADDAMFVVGRCVPDRDWPYVHPGPADAWAGARSHTFSIVFALEQAPAEGVARLSVALVDTHAAAPPRLAITINGRTFERTMPNGASDASVNGKPELGKPYRFEVEFPASLLKVGNNTIQIANEQGSWLVYDCLALHAPTAAKLGEVKGTIVMLRTRAIRALVERGGKLWQPVVVSLRNLGGDTQAILRLDGAEVDRRQIGATPQDVELLVPAVEAEKRLAISVEAGGQVFPAEATLKPTRKMVVYILPHSHTDIGYTEIQTAIEDKQMQNLVKGIEYARKTASYPAGAQFKWNVEVLWAADLYLHRMSQAQRAEFIDAVKKGWVGLNGMYLNELTGLCRPEELLRLFQYAQRLGELCGVSIDSAMISDVPGYTWGTIQAMNHAGIRYFSVAPNFFDRIGDILVQWENKPFWWVSKSGREKVLVWIPLKGYAMSHIVRKLSPQWVEDYQAQLQAMNYPYDIAHIRWSGHGDNAEPDPTISEFVKEWNTKYAYPKFVIASTSEAFSAFEKRYGHRLPEVRGDWTPYWEDGAGSSALETAMNRATSDRLVQAETLHALRNTAYPAGAFEEAWRNTLLYSEHTWGAWCSVSDPENQATKEQWEIKRSYALQADQQSRELLRRALNIRNVDTTSSAVDLYNTTSWPRTELVVLSKEQSAAGDRVTDDRGRPVSSQRLSTGELAFVAHDIPPFAARRYTLSKATAHRPESAASAQGTVLENQMLRVRIDEKTGAIVELIIKGQEHNFVDTTGGHAINDYLYLPGDDLTNLQRNGTPRIRVKESGPLVASLLIESDAPGCNKLIREVRLTAGFDHLELINTVDKKRAPANPKPGDWSFAQKGGKESVNFAFPFNVKDGAMRIDIPFAVMQPEIDQMPSACKNWLTVGRWVDVANAKRGITWVTLDAPLIQVGGITATLLGSQSNPDVWRKHIEPTQKLYSWAMNNHWGTNYRAYQEGPVVFRYILRPHDGYDPVEAAKFSTAQSQPLVASAAAGQAPSNAPRLQVEGDGVLVTAFKPSEDGKAWIIRLFGASDTTRQVKLSWSDPQPRNLWQTDLSEKPGKQVNGAITVPAWGIVTLRAERP